MVSNMLLCEVLSRTAADGGMQGVNNNPATNDPSPLDQIREQTSKIEDFFDSISEPLKPCVSPLLSLPPCLLRARS